MSLGGAKDEHFSCFHSSCQLGLKNRRSSDGICGKKGRPLGGSKCKYLFKPERAPTYCELASEWLGVMSSFFSLKSPPSQESKERKAERPFSLYLYLQGRRNFVLVYRCRGVSSSCFKRQLISKGLFKIFICTKKRTKIFCISALASKKRSNQKNKGTNWRILFWLSYTTFLIWPLFRG